jgi:hypothetical protein
MTEQTDLQKAWKALELAFKAMSGSPTCLRRCAGCGVKVRLSIYAPCRYCRECAARRKAEANRRAQRRRRYWEKRVRHKAAGLVEGTLACAHCGKRFRPQRSSARYCSTRCRVAAHRHKKRQ